MSDMLLAKGHAYLGFAWMPLVLASLGKAILAIRSETNRLTPTSKEKLEIIGTKVGWSINQTHPPLGFLAE
jgi:hypothetical protein